MNLILGYDRETLRELVDERDCQDRLAEIETQRSLPALLERAWLSKVLGDLDGALALANQAVRTARMAGTRKDLLRARIMRASVQHYRGAYPTAIIELNACIDEAEGHGWPSVGAFAATHLGKTHFDERDFDSARKAFKQALFLRRESGAGDEELESSLLAIDTVDRHATEMSEPQPMV